MKQQDFYDAEFWRFKIEDELPVYPFCSEDSTRYAPRKINEIRHPFLLICGICDGAVQFVFRKQKITLHRQDILLIPPQMPYFFESYSCGGYYRKRVLELQGSLLGDLLQKLKLDQICRFDNSLWGDFSATFDLIHEANRRGNPEDIPEVAAALVKLLHICSLKNLPPEKKENHQLVSACRWIEEHLNIPVDLTLLEDQLNISRSTIGRLFRNGKGMSPRQYWLNRKTETAKYLLLHSDFSIKEIAWRLGYSSQFHFSNEFSKRHGFSPLHFRKRGFI